MKLLKFRGNLTESDADSLLIPVAMTGEVADVIDEAVNIMVPEILPLLTELAGHGDIQPGRVIVFEDVYPVVIALPMWDGQPTSTLSEDWLRVGLKWLVANEVNLPFSSVAVPYMGEGIPLDDMLKSLLAETEFVIQVVM